MTRNTRLKKLIQTVMRLDSSNPPGREGPLARLVAQDMRSLGLAVKTYAFARGRPNVIAILKSPSRKGNGRSHPTLLMTPHMDTVPFGQGWTHHPLSARIHQGRIYGRGASDDKGNLACCMEVMRRLVEDHVELDFDVMMAATVDEETGSHFGIIPLLQQGILKPRAAIILDADNADAIVAQKGLFHGRIQIFGKKAHGAYNWRGSNAIETAARVIHRLKKHRFPFRPHALMRGPTVNIGQIRGGDKVNIVADFCEVAVDVRFLPGTASHDLLRDIRSIIRQETRHFDLKIDSLQQPYEISRRHPLVQTYCRTARHLGLKVRIKGSEGATVMTFFGQHGIPAFATGYGTPGTAHTTDEYAQLDTFMQGARLLDRFIRDFTFETSPV